MVNRWLTRKSPAAWRDVRLAYSPLAAKAEQEFRDAIIQGMIRPYIRHPSTGDILSLPLDEWQGSNSAEGFHSDYVGPECNNSNPALLQVPGPDTRIGGAGSQQTVFFCRIEFEAWLVGNQSRPGKSVAIPRKGKVSAVARFMKEKYGSKRPSRTIDQLNLNSWSGTVMILKQQPCRRQNHAQWI